jgi:hypothetical protein
MFDRNLRQILRTSSCQKFAGHAIEQRCAPLASTRDSCLGANAGPQVRDNQCHDQHDGESDHVLEIGDR